MLKILNTSICGGSIYECVYVDICLIYVLLNCSVNLKKICFNIDIYKWGGQGVDFLKFCTFETEPILFQKQENIRDGQLKICCKTPSQFVHNSMYTMLSMLDFREIILYVDIGPLCFPYKLIVVDQT